MAKAKATDATKPTKTTKATPKVTKTITKAATKKAAAKPVPAAPEKAKAIVAKAKADKKSKKDTNTSDDKKSLEMCLLCDCTGSMASWIQRSKETLSGIINNVKNEHGDLTVRVSFVGYRDIKDKPRFEIFEFSEDLDACSKFIGTMKATGGDDTAEDV